MLYRNNEIENAWTKESTNTSIQWIPQSSHQKNVYEDMLFFNIK